MSEQSRTRTLSSYDLGQFEGIRLRAARLGRLHRRLRRMAMWAASGLAIGAAYVAHDYAATRPMPCQIYAIDSAGNLYVAGVGASLDLAMQAAELPHDWTRIFARDCDMP